MSIGRCLSNGQFLNGNSIVKSGENHLMDTQSFDFPSSQCPHNVNCLNRKFGLKSFKLKIFSESWLKLIVEIPDFRTRAPDLIPINAEHVVDSLHSLNSIQ